MDVLAVVAVIIGIIVEALRQSRTAPTTPRQQRPSTATGILPPAQGIPAPAAVQAAPGGNRSAEPPTLAGPQRRSLLGPSAIATKSGAAPAIPRSSAPMSEVALKFAEERRLKDAEVARAFASFSSDNETKYNQSASDANFAGSVQDAGLSWSGPLAAGAALTSSQLMNAIIVSQVLGARRGKGQQPRTVR